MFPRISLDEIEWVLMQTFLIRCEDKPAVQNCIKSMFIFFMAPVSCLLESRVEDCLTKAPPQNILSSSRWISGSG